MSEEIEWYGKEVRLTEDVVLNPGVKFSDDPEINQRLEEFLEIYKSAMAQAAKERE